MQLLRRFSFLACGRPRTICCAISSSASSYLLQAHRCGPKVLVNVGFRQRACTLLVRLLLSPPSFRPTPRMLGHHERSGRRNCDVWRHDGHQRNSCLLRGTLGSVAPGVSVSGDVAPCGVAPGRATAHLAMSRDGQYDGGGWHPGVVTPRRHSARGGVAASRRRGSAAGGGATPQRGERRRGSRQRCVGWRCDGWLRVGRRRGGRRSGDEWQSGGGRRGRQQRGRCFTGSRQWDSLWREGR